MPKLVAYSDVHELFREAGTFEPAKFHVFCGDYQSGKRDTFEENLHVLDSFLWWFGKQPAQYKVFVAGNHDKCLCGSFLSEQERKRVQDLLLYHEERHSVFLLNGPSCIGGEVFYGKPSMYPVVDPYDFSTRPLLISWCQSNTSFWEQHKGKLLLVSHSPPRNILDLSIKGGYENTGEEPLRVLGEKFARYHFFGHIHESYGRVGKFMNCSLCDRSSPRKIKNKPWVVEL